MKSLKMFSLLVFTLLLTTACSKSTDEAPEINAVITDEEAVKLIEDALAANSQGIASDITELTTLAKRIPQLQENQIAMDRSNPFDLECNVTQDTAFTFSENIANFSTDYALNASYKMNCNQFNIPQTLEYNKIGTGSYESTRLIAENTSESAWSLSNLIMGTEFILGGNYTRTGTYQSKVRNQKEFSATLILSASNLSVSKTMQMLVAGETTVNLSGTDGDGNEATFSGTITFIGNQMAVLILNGETYEIDWSK